MFYLICSCFLIFHSLLLCSYSYFFFFSSRRRHTRCALVTGVQTCALPIFMPAKGDHADGIQLWTAGTNAPSKNIEISSNLIVGKLGAQMQGIFVTDQSGGKLPYSGITIKNNTLVGTAWHGITFYHPINASVPGNTTVTIPGSPPTTNKTK